MRKQDVKKRTFTHLLPFCQLPKPMQNREVYAAYQLLLEKERYLRLRGLSERTLSALLLLMMGPLFLAVGWRIHLEDGGPVFYRQQRIGRYGQPFSICKFRTMAPESDHLSKLTLAGDGRVTQIGEFLRRTRLDELPQLWNILLGQMSFVGPRPEVWEYVKGYTPDMYATLLVPPGLTSRASLFFRGESVLLDGPQPDKMYRERLLPAKMALNETYLYDISLEEDFKIVLATIGALWGRRGN